MIQQGSLLTKHFRYVADFSCIADKCPDTCCSGWRITVEPLQKSLYSQKAPELLEYVLIDDNGDHMKMQSGQCSQLNHGLCYIHSNYGEDFLSDTCYFYPKKVVGLGKTTLVSAETSCPEIARLILTNDAPFELIDKPISRTPRDSIFYDLDERKEKQSLSVMSRFLDLAENKDVSAEYVMTRIIHIAQHLDLHPTHRWLEIIDSLSMEDIVYSVGADSNTDINPMDIVDCLKQLCTNTSEKWQRLIETIEHASRAEYFFHKDINHAIKRFIGADMIRRMFPYGSEKGLEQTVSEKAMISIILACFFREAIYARCTMQQTPPNQDTMISIFQTISKEINHLLFPLGDHFKQQGWCESDRLKGLVNYYRSENLKETEYCLSVA
jgi:lysine-N-methylase